MNFYFPPINQSGYTFLLLLTGIISIVNGLSLIFDDRKLNRFLSSPLLINSGAILIFDGLSLIGYKQFDSLKKSTLVIQVFIGILSIFFVWGYHHERKQKIRERTSQKPTYYDNSDQSQGEDGNSNY